MRLPVIGADGIARSNSFRGMHVSFDNEKRGFPVVRVPGRCVKQGARTYLRDLTYTRGMIYFTTFTSLVPTETDTDSLRQAER